MNLSLVGNILRIELEWYEQLLAFNWDKTLEISLEHIEQVSTQEPSSSWAEIRAPGTALPGVIKAGTYYSSRGREFWYVTQDKNYLVLELRDESFKKIILTLEHNQSWAERIVQSKDSL